MKRKAAIGIEKILMILIVLLTLALIFAFIYEADILAYFRSIPVPSVPEDEIFVDGSGTLVGDGGVVKGKVTAERGIEGINKQFIESTEIYLDGETLAYHFPGYLNDIPGLGVIGEDKTISVNKKYFEPTSKEYNKIRMKVADTNFWKVFPSLDGAQIMSGNLIVKDSGVESTLPSEQPRLYKKDVFEASFNWDENTPEDVLRVRFGELKTYGGKKFLQVLIPGIRKTDPLQKFYIYLFPFKDKILIGDFTRIGAGYNGLLYIYPDNSVWVDKNSWIEGDFLWSREFQGREGVERFAFKQNSEFGGTTKFESNLLMDYDELLKIYNEKVNKK